MQKTIRDIQKIGSKAQNALKFAMYYIYIPAIVYMGIKTVNW